MIKPIKHRWWGIVLGIAMLAWCLPLMAAEPLVVGVLHLGDFAYAAMMRTALDMALEEINAANGIKGRPLVLAYADDRGEVIAGERAVRGLVKEKKAVMLVGGYSSSNTLQMAYAAERLDIPLLVCTAADDRITQHGLKNVYRLNPPVSEYTKGLEEFLLDRIKPKSMSIVYENSPFGTGSAMRMMWFCRENDIAITAIQPYFKSGITARRIEKVLAPVKQDPPDLIFMSAYLDDAVLLVNTIREMNISSVMCGGAGGFTHADFCQRTGSQSEHMLTATLWSPSGNNRLASDFFDRFTKRSASNPDYHAAEAYSALLLTAEVLRRSPSTAAADIRSTLDAIHMNTPFGEVTFDDYGPYKRQNNSKTQVFQVIDGRFETIWPDHLATRAYSTGPR